MAVVNVEDETSCQNVLPSLPRGKKSTKANLPRRGSTLVLNDILKVMLADSQDAMAKHDKKKRLGKEATAAININLTKEAIKLQRLDTEAKCRAEDARIMLADLSNMDIDQHSWFEKEQAEIHQQDA
jgi:hypothetical protein